MNNYLPWSRCKKDEIDFCDFDLFFVIFASQEDFCEWSFGKTDIYVKQASFFSP